MDGFKSVETILEICVDSVQSAIIAEQGGAARIELCSALDLGGLTPSAGTVAAAKKQVKIPIFMMIRPRPGNFVYNPEEAEAMLKDIETGLSLGVDGFVTGALTDQYMVDKPLCQKLVEAAQGKPVTFHRAFDLARQGIDSILNDIVELGFKRILTSGRAKSAIEGISVIKDLAKKADSRIIIMPGCGIKPGNIREIAHETDAVEFHASGRFPKYEFFDEPPVVEGTELYRAADIFQITCLQEELCKLRKFAGVFQDELSFDFL